MYLLTSFSNSSLLLLLHPLYNAHICPQSCRLFCMRYVSAEYRRYQRLSSLQIWVYVSVWPPQYPVFTQHATLRSIGDSGASRLFRFEFMLVYDPQYPVSAQNTILRSIGDGGASCLFKFEFKLVYDLPNIQFHPKMLYCGVSLIAAPLVSSDSSSS